MEVREEAKQSTPSAMSSFQSSQVYRTATEPPSQPQSQYGYVTAETGQSEPQYNFVTLETHPQYTPNASQPNMYVEVIFLIIVSTCFLGY